MTEVPIRRRDGSVRAVALIDDEDADLAELRWHALGSLPGGRFYAGHAGRVDGKVVQSYMHVEILKRMGHDPGTYECGDHIDRDPLNNQRANLRATTQSVNAANREDKGGRPRTLKDHPKRRCHECRSWFRPRRKSAAATARFCSRLCQRRNVARANARRIAEGVSA